VQRRALVGSAQVRRPGLPLRVATSTTLVQLAASSRAGIRFQAKRERELDDALFALAAKLPASEGCVAVCREFTGPRGIPDLLATTRYQQELAARDEAAVPAITNRSEANVLAALPHGSHRTLPWVAEACGLSLLLAQERLRGLSRVGAVLMENGGYRRHPTLVPLGHTYAFEAKVADWGKGLEQALRYLTWADSASIVLLDPPKDLGRASAQCQSLGVGLAVGDVWKVRPKLGKPNRGLRLAASEAWFRDFAPHKPSADA
jgi:hypothetical protein